MMVELSMTWQKKGGVEGALIMIELRVTHTKT